LPIETTVRNSSKGGKPDRKPHHPYGLRKSIQNNKLMKKLNFVHE
jgi:hypothetical protein